MSIFEKLIGRKAQRIERSLEKNLGIGRGGIEHQFSQADGRGFVCKARTRGAKPKKTATGAYSTNVSQLIKLKGTHPIIGELMEYREISKLVSTYIDALPKLVDAENRLHTHFDSFGATTGRLSSQNPNLQNIPKRSGKRQGSATSFYCRQRV